MRNLFGSCTKLGARRRTFRIGSLGLIVLLSTLSPARSQTIAVTFPTIASISPNSATSGGAAFQLNVTGTNYVNKSVVQWTVAGTSQPLSTTFVSSTRLTAAVPASLIVMPGAASVSVVNGYGALSSPMAFNIATASGTIPPQFFGFHVCPATYAGGNAWPTVNFGSMRLWDTQTKWADIHKAPGVFDFTKLDAKLATLGAHNISDAILTFGATPHWISSDPNNWNCSYAPENGAGVCDPPRDLNPDGTGTDQTWKDFITALAKHLNGRIKYFELWNEPTDPLQWHGTIAQLARMAKDASPILKAVDSQAKLTTGSAVGNLLWSAKDWMQQFLKAAGAQSIDIVAFHGYVGVRPPEEIIAIFNGVLQAVIANGGSNLPVWDSEASWGKDVIQLDPDLDAAYVARFYLLRAGLGIDRLYWYRWDSPERGTLWDPATGIRPSGTAYQQTYNWLVGAKMNGPCTAQGTVWTCKITRSGNFRALAVWDSSGTCSNGSCTTTNYTPDSSYIGYKTLDSGMATIRPGSPVKIGAKPILLVNQ